jgi:hypothetical protein
MHDRPAKPKGHGHKGQRNTVAHVPTAPVAAAGVIVTMIVKSKDGLGRESKRPFKCSER